MPTVADPLTESRTRRGRLRRHHRGFVGLVPAGRRVLFLEGGYDLEGLTRLGRATAVRAARRWRVPTSGHERRPRRRGGRRAHDARSMRRGRAPPDAPDELADDRCVARRDPRPPATGARPSRARWPSASTRPATGSTSSAGSSATCCSAAPLADAADIDLTTDARPDEIKALVARLGRRGVDPGRAVRHDRLPKTGGRDLRDHHAPRRGLRARLAQARGALRRRGRGRPVPARLHGQRHGAASLAAEPPELIDPFGGAADLAAGAAAHAAVARGCPSATTRCACCGPPASSPATGSRPTPELVAGGRSAGRSARDRVGRADPRRARQAARRRRPVGRAVVPRRHRPGRRSSCRSCRRCGSSRTRSTATRTCWPTRSRSWPRPDPSRIVRLAALLHDVGKPKTRSIGRDGRVASTTTRWSAPAWPATGMQALRYSNDDVEAVTPARVPAPALPHLRRWAGPTARCAASCATPATMLDELIELTRCDCTTRNQRKAEMLARRMDELEARIAELREQEELEAIRPDLDGRQVMEHLGIPPGPVVGRAPRLPARAAPRRGPAGRGRGRPAPRRLVGERSRTDPPRRGSGALLARSEQDRGRHVTHGVGEPRTAGAPRARSARAGVSTWKLARIRPVKISRIVRGWSTASSPPEVQGFGVGSS